MRYNEAITWLYSFEKFGIKLGLERIEFICEKLGNPQNNYKTVHVGGTNGKGSVCKFISSILNSAGYTVGVYTSPHIQHFSERFVIDNNEISDIEIVLLLEKIKPIVEEISFEKAGIIKENTPVISSAENTALAVIKKKTIEKNSSLTVVDKSCWEKTGGNLDWQNFTVHGKLKDYTVKTHLLGVFQGENLALSL